MYSRVWYELLTLDFVKGTRGYVKKAGFLSLPFILNNQIPQIIILSIATTNRPHVEFVGLRDVVHGTTGHKNEPRVLGTGRIRSTRPVVVVLHI